MEGTQLFTLPTGSIAIATHHVDCWRFPIWICRWVLRSCHDVITRGWNELQTHHCEFSNLPSIPTKRNCQQLTHNSRTIRQTTMGFVRRDCSVCFQGQRERHLIVHKAWVCARKRVRRWQRVHDLEHSHMSVKHRISWWRLWYTLEYHSTTEVLSAMADSSLPLLLLTSNK
jgi:hypothetical protein